MTPTSDPNGQVLPYLGRTDAQGNKLAVDQPLEAATLVKTANRFVTAIGSKDPHDVGWTGNGIDLGSVTVNGLPVQPEHENRIAGMPIVPFGQSALSYRSTDQRNGFALQGVQNPAVPAGALDTLCFVTMVQSVGRSVCYYIRAENASNSTSQPLASISLTQPRPDGTIDTWGGAVRPVTALGPVPATEGAALAMELGQQVVQ